MNKHLKEKTKAPAASSKQMWESPEGGLICQVEPKTSH